MDNGNSLDYEKSKSYWANIPATIDGMLGGHSAVFNADIQASSRFITSFIEDKKNPLGKKYALDCGSGIGRITKHFLLKFFQNVEMVEQNNEFLEASNAYLEKDSCRVSRRFHCGLQDFVADSKFYDLIWIQWVNGYLTNTDLVQFYRRCKEGLNENGLIVVKDNLSSGDEEIDHEDGSVTRPREQYLNLFKEAGLTIILERKQYKFPKGLYEVKMFALR